MNDKTISLNHAYRIMKDLDLVSQEQTVRKWVREGKLEGTKEANHIGYQINVESLERLIKDKQMTALKRKKVYQQGFEDGYNKAERLYKQLDYPSLDEK